MSNFLFNPMMIRLFYTTVILFILALGTGERSLAACLEGDTQPCANACGTGLETCKDGVWIKCDAPLPQDEQCDGLDNDCDGAVDNGFDVGLPCDGKDSDQCMNGTYTCKRKKNGVECVNENPAGIQEVCDGLDNDCDGTIDNGFAVGQPCDGNDTDECVNGTTTCHADGSGVECVNEDPADIQETCDGLDNNCDGVTDEGCECLHGKIQRCSNACGRGNETCEFGLWTGCTAPEPQPEICDGLDNDCDGVSDNGFPIGEVCDGGDLDQCRYGTYTCSADGTGMECLNESRTDIEEVCNGLDDDCDGVIDNHLTAPLNFRQDGVCAGSIQVCSGPGIWQESYDGIEGYEPDEVSCDGRDNDCDGEMDEDCAPRVIKTEPGSGKLGVSIAANVEIDFNKIMDMVSFPDPSGIVSISDVSDGRTPAEISHASRWEQGGKVIIADPAKDFHAGSNYQIRVSESVADLLGYGLDGNNDRFPGGDYLFTFSTELDGDTLSDDEEKELGTDPFDSDTDGDGISDAIEVGILFRTQGPFDTDKDGTIDALDDDSDGDGKPDRIEGTGDDDEDGSPNFRDFIDDDGPFGDQDGDGISNVDEAELSGTDPNTSDSDGDGIDDPVEVGPDISNPLETDGDGIIDAWDQDSDNDGCPDGMEKDLDENQNSVPDRLENIIVSGFSTIIRLDNPAGAGLEDVRIVPVEDYPAEGRPGVNFMFKLVYFRVVNLLPEASAQLRIIYDQDIPAGSKYFKYSQEHGWTVYNNVTGLEDGDNELLLTLKDGATGDDDMEVNGEIIDPSGVGVLPLSTDDDNVVVQQVETPSSLSSRGGGSSGCSVNEPAGFAEQGWVWIILILALLRFRLRFLKKRLKVRIEK